MNKIQVQQYWSKVNNWETFLNSYFSDDETTHPHMRSKWLVDVFSELGFKSVLEIGSNCGRNLYHIKRAFPKVDVAGIDINAQAVEFSKTKVDGEFFVGSVYDLKKIISKKYDLVFSVATLCYVAPESINDVLTQVLRVSKKYIYHFERFGKGEPVVGETQSQEFWALDMPGFYKEQGISYDLCSIPNDMQDITLREIIKVNEKRN